MNALFANIKYINRYLKDDKTEYATPLLTDVKAVVFSRIIQDIYTDCISESPKVRISFEQSQLGQIKEYGTDFILTIANNIDMVAPQYVQVTKQAISVIVNRENGIAVTPYRCLVPTAKINYISDKPIFGSMFDSHSNMLNRGCNDTGCYIMLEMEGMQNKLLWTAQSFTSVAAQLCGGYMLNDCTFINPPAPTIPELLQTSKITYTRIASKQIFGFDLFASPDIFAGLDLAVSCTWQVNELGPGPAPYTLTNPSQWKQRITAFYGDEYKAQVIAEITFNSGKKAKVSCIVWCYTSGPDFISELHVLSYSMNAATYKLNLVGTATGGQGGTRYRYTNLGTVPVISSPYDSYGFDKQNDSVYEVTQPAMPMLFDYSVAGDYKGRYSIDDTAVDGIDVGLDILFAETIFKTL